MKRFIFCGLIAATALGLTGAKLYITQDQALVGDVLDSLKLEHVPARGGLIGGPQEYKVTQKTLNYLKGKSFIVAGDGSIEVKK